MGLKSSQLVFDNKLKYKKYVPIENTQFNNKQIIGSSGSTEYSYVVTCYNSEGESLPSDPIIISDGNSVLSTSNYVRLFWNDTETADGYNIYKYENGYYKFLETTKHWHCDDNGKTLSERYPPAVNNTGYSSGSVNLGPLMRSYLGNIKEDNYVGPKKPQYMMNYVLGNGNIWISRAVSYTNKLDWLFCIDTSNRQCLQIVQYDRKKEEIKQLCGVFFTMPTSQFYIRDCIPFVEKSSSGYVNVSGNTVTGTGTLWDTLRFSVGSRIAFGTTNPDLVDTWYEVASITNDTTLTLLETLNKTYPSNCPYIIEEIQIVAGWYSNISPYDTGGVFIHKGLTPTGMSWRRTIPMATTVDRQRATYKLTQDSINNKITDTSRLSFEPRRSNDEQIVYVLDHYSAVAILKYNIRKPLLNIVNGNSTSTFLYNTGYLNIQDNSSGWSLCATVNHGPGKNVPSLYYNHASSISRTQLSDIRPNYLNFIYDNWVPRPEGGAYFTVVNPQSYFQYIDELDFFAGTDGTFFSLFKYESISTQFYHSFGYADFMYGSEAAYFDKEEIGYNTASGIYFLYHKGYWYVHNFTYNFIVYPFNADWMFAEKTKNRIITPVMNCSDALSFKKAIVSHPEIIKDDDMGVIPEPFRLYVRTNGFSDDSGTWTLLDEVFDMSNVPISDQIQFMFEFRIMGKSCYPSRIYSVGFVYETDDYLPDQFIWNLSDSDNTNSAVGFEQTNLFISLSALQIDYYRTDTDVKVLTASSAENTNGNFQYWNGSSWINGIGPNIVGARRRFVPNQSLSISQDVYAKIKVL